MSSPLSLTLVGAGGLLAGEALGIVARHPELRLVNAVTRNPGIALKDMHPHLVGTSLADLQTSDLSSAIEGLRADLALGAGRVVLLLGLPHTESARTWSRLRKELGATAERVIVVDLSADYRLQDPSAYARWYGPHPDQAELSKFRYGLPELTGSKLAGTTRIAAPGCFATALQLACVPAAEADLLRFDQVWTLNAITGSSGAGIKPTVSTHHPLRAANLRAYGIAGHRHQAELLQALGKRPSLAFLPHAGPFVRGIYLSAVLPLKERLDLAGTRELYKERLGASGFVEVLAQGSVPELRHVIGSNRVQLALSGLPGEESPSEQCSAFVVLLALDNLIKGGAGQAIQALNLALGWPEDLGLPRSGFGIV